MVKGISRQVIVLHSPDPKLFEQAIFILRADAVGREGVTDEALLKEAKRLAGNHRRKPTSGLPGFAWSLLGAMVTGLIWLITCLI